MTIQLTTPGILPVVQVDCQAILDTGSDCTLVPLPLLMRVNGKVDGRSIRLAFSGDMTLATPYRVGLIFDRYTHPEFKVFGCPVYELGDYPIVGRDLMNLYSIKFNGPNETFTIF